ncbi:MAG TPA: HAMP domain-containing sensor histidine kinase [Gemmatimonadales bacterium]|nr:HAMP domain-containing sensor histidine kinase [Gemmatimonadales bacterium]
MLRPSFRVRLFIALLTIAALSMGVMAGVGVMALRRIPEVRLGGQQEIARLRTTAQELLIALNGVQLSPAGDDAKRAHERAVSDLLTRVDNIQGVARNFTRGGGIPRLLGATALVLLVVVAVFVALLSRQFSTPLDEVVAWTGRIRRREPLPTESESRGGIPEFAELRSALHDLSESIEQGRRAELEAERLRTFGEVARRVAHEMKNPLTPIRLAVLQMRRSGPGHHEEALEVIASESSRLEAMAREFAELGRLPEVPATPVDLRELLEEMLRASVPDTLEQRFESAESSVVVEAQYDPLRRAFSNLLRNAVDACGPSGGIIVTLAREPGVTVVSIADNGPGVPPDKRDLIFQPYYTDKRDGTGLGLAIARQTVEQHGGTITVTDTPGGGATFIVRLPE